MRIATVGCSWTSGIKTEGPYDSWPRRLSQRHTGWHVSNFGFPGGSQGYIAHMLTRIRDGAFGDFDLVIAQHTTVNREMFGLSRDIVYLWNDYCERKGKYHFWSNGKIHENLFAINPMLVSQFGPDHPYWQQHIDPAIREKSHQFANDYYDLLDQEMMFTRHVALVEYADRKSDISFFHRYDGISNTRCTQIPCMKELLSAQDYKDFSVDEGEHFGRAGIDWVTDWVENAILQRT